MGDSDWEGIVPSSGIDPIGSNWISAQAPPVPAAPTPTPAQVALPYNKTPEQLGWSPEEAQRFSAAGITMLPSYMSKAGLYGTGTNLGGDDPIQFFIDAQQKPSAGAPGKFGDAISVVGVDPGSAAWDDSAQRAYSQWLIHDKWKPNAGAFKESVLPAIQGIGSIASVATGLGALGAFAAPVTGAIEGGMTAAEASALAGESAAGYGAAGAAGGAAAGGGLSAAEAGALLGESGAGYGAGGASGMGSLAESIAAGQAAGADVGMGAGTSWLTDLGLPASYGNDLGALLSYGGDTLAGLDWGKLLDGGLNIGNLIGGGTGLTGITQPVNIMSSGGTTSAPQTSQILQPIPMGTGTAVAPATMPTGSIMSAYGDKGRSDDYKKYFSNLF